MSKCASSRDTKFNRSNLRKRYSNSYKLVKNQNKCATKCNNKNNKIKQYYTSTVGSTLTANHAVNKSDNEAFKNYSDTNEKLYKQKEDSTTSGGTEYSDDNV